MHMYISLSSLNFQLRRRQNMCIFLCRLQTLIYDRDNYICICQCHLATVIYDREQYRCIFLCHPSTAIDHRAKYVCVFLCSLPTFIYDKGKYICEEYTCVFLCHLSMPEKTRMYLSVISQCICLSSLNFITYEREIHMHVSLSPQL